ncbi:hypothetical protein [Pararhodonellum marinum]|uniref:hypothetical protein n=1 Tax=Pararhodonellum marinum TaxID=2755358 RepID=UPI00188F885C|nr:hypothetical protein [Pararhodonellum marinum]
MERAFDFNRIIPPLTKMLETPVQLFNQHLVLYLDVAEGFIGESRQVFASFINEENKLLLANVSNVGFKAKHKPIMLFVKQKNVRGDKSISLQEFFADWPHISKHNRELKYLFNENEGILEINLCV